MSDDRDRIRRLLNSEDDTHGEPPIQPAAPGGPVFAHPALDKDNMPLPRRVDEFDVGGTTVTPAAYEPSTSRHRAAPPGSGNPPLNFNWQNFHSRRGLACLVYGLIAGTFLFVILGLCLGSVFLYEYYSIARSLPTVGDLKQRASQFETTRILDRNGNLLYEILDPNAGRRTYVTLDRVSPALVAATIATEDKDFYIHPGYDFWAILRALWQNYTTGDTVSGASTITQQLARALLLTPEERGQRTYLRKAREIILAAEITRRYSKDQILELYLNEIYYGNLAYGIEAAAETYFGTTADKLTLSQAAFLAGLPQSPAIYDIYTNPGGTLLRQQQVLVLMFSLSNERGCIEVSNSPAPVCVDATSASSAANEMKAYTFKTPDIDIRYPHWVNYVRSQLEAQYDAQTIYRSGFTIYTTLDPTLQDMAQQLVTDQVAQLVDKNAHNGALVAIRPSTGEVLAMVGSPDFYNADISGQVNMAVSATRQPGSSIKPITYVTAFENGWTPATLIWDVPSEFPPSGDPNDTREPYRPVNYDGKFHGPVTVRTALSNSFNMPAVKTLNFVGIYGDHGMIAMAKRLGLTSLTRDDYGLSLTLGGGDVSLIDMVSVFSVFANGGVKVPPVTILKITDHEGKLVYEYTPQQGEQVIRPEHAYLINSILSDNEARSWMFGPNSVLNLPFTVAAKTGTTNDFRDNWTLGYTPDLAAGVWIGNADYTPMVNTTGLTGAAPIWSQFMQSAVPYISSGNPSPFLRPAGIMDKVICSLSGTEPSKWCKNQRSEVFASDQPPLPSGQDLRRVIKIDTWTGLEASNACGTDFVEEETVINVKDPFARDWFKSEDGKNWLDNNGFPRRPVYAPDRECNQNDPRPLLDFSLNEGQVISDSTLEIKGTADATGGFKSWRLDYAQGNSDNWNTLAQGSQPVKNAILANWNLAGVPNGVISLRLHLEGTDGFAEKTIHITIQIQPPTEVPPPPTLIPTLTPFPTQTDTPVPIITPTDTPVPSETPTEFPTP